MHEAVLDREPVDPAAVHRLAQVEHAPAIVRMQVLHPEVQDPEFRFAFRGHAADVAESVVDMGGAPGQVHLIERETGEVRCRREPGLTGAQRLLARLRSVMSSTTEMKCRGSPAAVRRSETVRLIHTTERSLRTYRFSIEQVEIWPERTSRTCRRSTSRSSGWVMS